MKIRVIFDLEVLGNSYKNNQTGIFRVTYELLRRFMFNNKLDVLYSNFNFNNDRKMKSKIGRFLSDEDLSIKSVNSCERIKFIPFRKEKLFKKIYRKFGIFDYQIKFNSQINNSQIYHTLYYPIHFSLQKYQHIKKIVTIHDLIPILFPQYNANTELLEKTIYSVGSNNFVICVSENTKKDLLKYAPQIDPNKVFVSLLAASKDFFYKCDDEKKFSEVQKKYNIPNKYFLSLSTLEPRKNIDHVIRSFVKMIIDRKINDLSLVLVGNKGWDFDNIFKEYENAKELKDKIIITGHIPDEDLASIYSNANSFYYMSFYEGFGLPPLEAMQCGTAVVVSNTSSLPEVVGDAGILLDPTDQDQLVDTMWEIYDNDEYRQDLGRKAIEQSKNFSWEKTVAEHLKIYETILQF
ncbi:glycosyltransferase family 4 protein [Epilithonimonas sp.]|uniref:glycosyltransferase family 4 protein n=1 Tax=Epilithonimonas sp. TaxID=2894511 RepID=UPI002FDDC918